MSRFGRGNVRSYTIILAIFVLFNIVLHCLSVDKIEDGILYKATYWNASDGQRYWGAAVNLASKSEFSLPSQYNEPLSRAGPVPAIVFAAPIKLFGLYSGASWIVLLQCVLLCFIGFFTAKISSRLGLSGVLTFGLVLFNPNLVGLAHHAQSDLLFTFLFSALLYLSVEVISKSERVRFREFGLLGFLAGLLSLTRGVGQYFALLLPFLIGLAVWLIQENKRGQVTHWLLGIGTYLLVGCLVVTPWAIRNSNVLDSFGLTQSEAIMMRDNYKFLLRFNGDELRKAAPSLEAAAEIYFVRNNFDLDCLSKFKDRECKGLLARAYLAAIVDTGSIAIAKAAVSAWAGLFLSGSTSRIANYLGLDATSFHEIMISKYEGPVSVLRYLGATISRNPSYAVMLILCTLYAIGGRVVGIIGIWQLFRCRGGHSKILTAFLLTSLLIFVGLYLFVGISRYRAPLEPILAILAVAGIERLQGKVIDRNNQI